MTLKSIRQLASFVGRSFSMLGRDFRKGKFREEPGGGFDVAKVKAAFARSTDPAQPPAVRLAPGRSAGQCRHAAV